MQTISESYQDKDCKFINLVKDDDLKTPATLRHLALKITSEDNKRRPTIIKELLKKFATKTGNSLIFCKTKKDVEILSMRLEDEGIINEPLHGDVAQSRRESAYRRYKEGKLKCLIATDVAARGLDFPEIDLIIQTEPPENPEPYIHRSGRTARKGR